MKSITSFLYTNRHHFCVTAIFLCIFAFSVDSVFAVSPTETAEGGGGFMSEWVGKPLANLVLSISMAIGGVFVVLGGVLLDGAITETILNAGEWLGDGSSVGTGIREMWIVIRDIFNIVFIFAFIYIGIKTILNADDSGAKRSLGLLIVAALLINFSLYFAQVIIDFSNIAAVQVHNQILKTEGVSSGETIISQDTLEPQFNSVVGAFMDTVNITSWWGGAGNIASASQIFVYAIMMLFFLIITGIVCGMGAILLIRRFISLIIYLILSPIMFAGWIFPAFDGYQKKWRKGFLEQAFFAPAFLFMLYLSLFVLGRMKAGLGIGSDTQYGEAFNGSSFTIFLFFCMGIGFLYASIKIGEMMSIAGASGMVKLGQTLTDTGKALAYKHSVGYGAKYGVKGIDALSRATGMEFEQTRKHLETAANKGGGWVRGRDAREKDQKTSKARNARKTATQDIERAIASGANAAPNSPEQIRLEQAVTAAGTEHLVEMLNDKEEGSAEYQAIVSNMSQSQFDAVMKEKPETFNETQKDALKKARAKATQTGLIGPETGTTPRTEDQKTADFRKAIKEKASTNELLALGFDTLRANAEFIPASKMDDLQKSTLTDTQKRILADDRKTKILDASPAELALIIANQKPKDIVKLPKDLFTDSGRIDTMMPYLNSTVLEVIGNSVNENMILNQAERIELRRHILASPGCLADASAYLGTTKGKNAYK